MQESFKIKNWPIGNNRGYVQLVNPLLLREFAKNGLNPCPVSVVSYRKENDESLTAIQEQAFKRLETMLYRSISKPDSAAYFLGWGVPSIFCISGVLTGASFGIPEFIAGGSLFELLTLGITGGLWRRSNKKYQEKIAIVEKGIDLFKNTPVSKYHTSLDPELADINQAIEKNSLPKSIMPKDKPSYIGIDELLYNVGNSLTPNTKIIYEQMRAAYEGLLVDSLPSTRGHA